MSIPKERYTPWQFNKYINTTTLLLFRTEELNIPTLALEDEMAKIIQRKN
jgi:hypothetical protein